jgi:hypothetical protein
LPTALLCGIGEIAMVAFAGKIEKSPQYSASFRSHEGKLLLEVFTETSCAMFNVFRLHFEQIYCKEENGNLLVCGSDLGGGNEKVIAVLPL